MPFSEQGNKSRLSMPQNETAETIHIQMLGDFVLQCSGHTLSGDKVRAKQIWNLLEFILVNRNKEVSAEKLIDVLWDEDSLDDPANALKNLAYRLRTIIKKNLNLTRNDFVIYKHGAYIWNPEFPCIIDADEFETAYHAALQDGISEDERIWHFKKAIELYKGNFLPQSSYKEWVVPLSIYYERFYMDAVEKYCKIMIQNQEFKEVEEVCRNAIVVDPFTETTHALLIKALISTNNQKKAKQHYFSVREMFRDELGVEPSDVITRLYEDVINSHAAFEKDIALVKKDLREAEAVKEALSCNYEMFKLIYRLQARAALRTGQSIYIMLLALSPAAADQSHISTKDWVTTMDSVKTVLAAALRRNDVIALYGKTQLLVMLSDITYDNTLTVLNRLIDTLREHGFSNKISVCGQIETLDPIGAKD